MAFQRRAGNRFSGSIWPGFVDAITSLLMVMVFVLSIFMIVQFVLSEEITSQDGELNTLNAQLSALSEALGLEETRAAQLESLVATLSGSLQAAEDELGAQGALIANFEARVASLIAANTALEAERDETAAELAASLSAAEALQLALASARSEVDAASEQARLAAALRAALEAQIADLETEAETRAQSLAEAVAALVVARTNAQDQATDIEALQAELSQQQTRLAQLEAAEAARLAAEAEELERYRSEFFGRLRDLLEGREGVRIEGDRFVFSSEVLFEVGSADLAPEGLSQVASVAELLAEIANEIPEGIDWIVRVDGHTDDQQIRPGAEFSSNWDLSQARALSVVLYLSEQLGFSPDRLAATGFGEFSPIASNETAEGRAQNRRIELKLTER